MQKAAYSNGTGAGYGNGGGNGGGGRNGYSAGVPQHGNGHGGGPGGGQGEYHGGGEAYPGGPAGGGQSQNRVNRAGNGGSGGERRRPVHEFRLGRIKAAVWMNETENGPRYSVSINKSYKDGETWKDTQYFTRDDLLLVSKIADQAHTWIYAQSNDAAGRQG